MMLRKLWLFTRMLQNKEIRRTLQKFHRKMSLDKRYHLKNGLKAFWNFLRYEKIIKFGDVYVVNSFYPPFPGKAFEQVFNATSDSDRDFFDNFRKGKRVAPLSCYIGITDACTYNCWHCSVANRNFDGMMSTETVKKVIKDLQDMGVSIIGFTGGEPLLRNDLTEIISSIDNRSISIVFSTGYGLTYEKAKKLKEAGLFGFAVSLDHYIPEIHNKKRRFPEAFNHAINSIKICKNIGFFTMLQTVATKELLNSGEIWKFIEFGKSLGVNEIRILEPLKCGRLLDKEENIFFTEEERKQLIDIHKKANKNQKYPVITTFAHFESEDQFGCSAGIHHSYIDATGNLCPCDFVPLSFGNVRKENVKPIWKRMNKLMGEQPRHRCFIQENADKIKEMSNGDLPLNFELSKEVCRKSNKGEIPKFYKIVGGK